MRPIKLLCQEIYRTMYARYTKNANSLVWGSLMLAPITSRKESNYKTYSTVQMYSNRNPARHAMNSTAIVIFLPRNSIIRRVNNIPAQRRVYWREHYTHNHLHTNSCCAISLLINTISYQMIQDTVGASPHKCICLCTHPIRLRNS